jgi:hypothetical protein
MARLAGGGGGGGDGGGGSGRSGTRGTRGRCSLPAPRRTGRGTAGPPDDPDDPDDAADDPADCPGGGAGGSGGGASPTVPVPFPVTNEFHSMLQRILGLSDAAREAVTITEGIDNMTKLGRKEKTDLAMLCKTLRRHRGQVEQRAVDGTVTMVNDPGIAMISCAAEHRLCMVAYIIRERAGYMSQNTQQTLISRK